MVKHDIQQSGSNLLQNIFNTQFVLELGKWKRIFIVAFTTLPEIPK